MKVRRSSDNTEQNIGFVGQDLDTDSLLSFCGAGDGFVSVWYNQGIDGSDYDVIQTTTSKQPRIVSGGVVIEDSDKPALLYDGTDDTLETKTSPTVTLGTPISIFGLAKCTKATNDVNLSTSWVRLIGNYSDCYWFIGRFWDRTLQSMYGDATYWQFLNSKSGDGCNLTANSTLTWYNNRLLVTTMQDGTDNYLYANGMYVNKTTNLQMPNFNGRFSVGGSFAGGTGQQIWQGTIQEIIIYKGQKLQLRTAIENNINAYFNIPDYKIDFTDPIYDRYYYLGLRLINPNYTGYCIKVRRSSDNTEQDIGFDNGVLDETALTTFCGTGNGFVSKWYDQGPIGYNVVQSDTSKQPQIVSSGAVLKLNGKPALYSDGTKYLRAESSTMEILQKTSYFLVGQTTVVHTYDYYMDGYASQNRHIIGNQNGSLFIWAGGELKFRVKLAGPEVITGIFAASNSTVTNATRKKTGSVGSNLFKDMVLFAISGGSTITPMTGYIQELRIYEGQDKTLTDGDSIVSELRSYFSIPDPEWPILYSLRLINPNYTGYCIKVRRSSDNTEQDIGFDNGVLDETALTTFCGTGNGFVSIWYDQGGLGYNLIQSATAANQPQIVSGGTVLKENNKPALVADGSTIMSITKTASEWMLFQASTHFIVGRTSTVTNDKHYIDGGTYRQLVGTASGKLCIYSGAILWHETKATTQELLYALFNGASSAIGRNGGTAVTGNAGLASLSNFSVFNNITGSIQEIRLYSADKSTERSTIESEINGFYSIY